MLPFLNDCLIEITNLLAWAGNSNYKLFLSDKTYAYFILQAKAFAQLTFATKSTNI